MGCVSISYRSCSILAPVSSIARRTGALPSGRITAPKMLTLTLLLTPHAPGVRRAAIQLAGVTSVPSTTSALTWSRALPMDASSRAERCACFTFCTVPRAALLPSHSCGHHLHLPLLLHGCHILGADGRVAAQVWTTCVSLRGLNFLQVRSSYWLGF